MHHGIFWGKVDRLTGQLHRRVSALIQADINLLAYHLPLDAAADWGNNFHALNLLGATELKPFAPHRGTPIGWYGDLKQPLPVTSLIQQCTETFQHPAIHCPGGPETIRRIGMVSGGGQNHLADAQAEECDAFICGETSEQNWHDAQELGIT